MNIITIIKRYLSSPRKLIRTLGHRGFFNWIPDKPYLKFIYWGETGCRLNLDNPLTFNEKLQWLKLYDRRPEYTRYVDKYAVRSYISETIGEEYLIPLVGVYNSVDEINWDELPDKFVLKCTHGSGCNIICEDKNRLDIESTRKKLNKWMKKSWYWFGREWPYKNVSQRIICEQYMVDESDTELKDYKIFCFNGEPKLIEVDSNRFTEHKRNIYTTEWKLLDVLINNYPTQPTYNIIKPRKLDDMMKMACILSQNIPHVRIDFYSINEKIFFGEMTFYPGSGYAKFWPESFGELLGSWISL